MNYQTETFLHEDFLRILDKIGIFARKGLKGKVKGEHVSWQSGASLEFLDYRKYQIGDDFRYIDWNVYGRLDKLFIKLFRAEKDITIHILIDVSHSMESGYPSKNICAKKIATALSYIGLTNLDRVRVVPFSNSIIDTMSPGGGRQVYMAILKYLLSLKPKGETDINASLSEYASVCKKPGIAIILSDLLDAKGIEEGVASLHVRSFDIILIQLLTQDELSPSLNGNILLKDIETGRTKKIEINQALTDRYKKNLNGFLETIRKVCLQYNADYYLYNTEIPFEEFFIEYVSKGTLFY
jgi:uncharacterized protein (DUF58 family)